MRLVYLDSSESTGIAVAWDWLPAFIANNYDLTSGLYDSLINRFGLLGGWGRDVYGEPFSPEIINKGLDEMHDYIVDQLVSRFEISGLAEYLRSISGVTADIKGKLIITKTINYRNKTCAKAYREMGEELRKLIGLEGGVDWKAVNRGEEVVDERTGIVIKKVD